MVPATFSAGSQKAKPNDSQQGTSAGSQQAMPTGSQPSVPVVPTPVVKTPQQQYEELCRMNHQRPISPVKTEDKPNKSMTDK